jgi:GNAT superfamily N-acetyltransferase
MSSVPPPVPASLPLPAPGAIHAVTGASGAGKSLALAAVPGATHVRALTQAQLKRPVLELFKATLPGEHVLRTLARMGLADGRLWGLRAGQLSAGERRRLEIALALCDTRGLIIVDELEAHLDAISARAVAFNFGRVIAALKLRAFVSTHRPEILPCLQAAAVFDITDHVATAQPPPQPQHPGDEVSITSGRASDYAAFARWHYLGHGRPGPVSDVLLVMHAGRAVGVAVFGYPHLLLKARARALPDLAPGKISREGAAHLNANLRLLQRVVVEPRYRGLGIAGRLIAAGLARVPTRYVECIAQMGDFSDFLLRAGFERVADINPPPAAARLRQRMQLHGLTQSDLLRGDLPGDVATALRQFARSRVQTGNGARRKRALELDPELLRRALARLGARPAYFLWRRP